MNECELCVTRYSIEVRSQVLRGVDLEGVIGLAQIDTGMSVR